MSADGKPAMELTRNPVDQSWGFTCLEHGFHRAGLTERHATNVEAKHIREQHARPELVLRLSDAAEAFLHEGGSRYAIRGATSVWEALTGLKGQAAVEYALSLLGMDATAATVPF